MSEEIKDGLETKVDGQQTEVTPVDEPTYTQADIDRIVGERLAREKAKAQKAIEDAKAEAERKKLEESNEYKALYEQSQAKIAEIEAQAKAAELHAKKQSLLIDAGYSKDALPDLLELVTGNDEETLNASIERVKRLVPLKAAHVDPSVNGNNRNQPTQKDATDYGRELFKKVIKK